MPLLDSALAAHGVALGHASLIAIDDRVPAAELLRDTWRFAAIESCGTCAPCRIGSGRGAGLARAGRRRRRVCAGRAATAPDNHGNGEHVRIRSWSPTSIRSLLRVYADELPA